MGQKKSKKEKSQMKIKVRKGMIQQKFSLHFTLPSLSIVVIEWEGKHGGKYNNSIEANDGTVAAKL